MKLNKQPLSVCCLLLNSNVTSGNQRVTDGTIILVTIYSKTEQEDIAAHEIRQIILAYETTADVKVDETPSETATEENTTTEST
jgi:hypothetical protein